MMSFIKAKIWSGAGWLLALCVILVSVTIIYFLLHSHYKGTDHKKLDVTQLANLDNVLANYPDISTTKADSIKAQREKRNQLIFVFLNNEYNNQIDSTCLKGLDPLLLGFNNKDTKLYLTSKEIIVKDFFWFTGQLTYLEVVLWALIGVLVSLIYYVSLANGQALKEAGDADTGPFDPSEISTQVSKMFYAPVCALVLVLGYNMLNSDSKMTDITIGKGLLLFAFICGFFSGRVIKFIDRLKDLVLPVSDASGGTAVLPGDGGDTTETNNTGSATETEATETTITPAETTTDTAETPATGHTQAIAVIVPHDTAVVVADATPPEPVATDADVTVNLQLSPAVAQSADGPDIVEGGFNIATVTFQPAGGGETITLTPPPADGGNNFTTKQLPFGEYTAVAEMAYKKANTIINLSATQTITVNADSENFDLLLDVTPVTG